MQRVTKLISAESQSFKCIKKATISFENRDLSVIRLGLEPRTPTLKVLCSTS